MSTLSLSLDALGQWYSPLEIDPSNGGWNESTSDGPAAYFISQGSEYRLKQPSTQDVTTLTAAQISSIQEASKHIQGLVDASPNATAQMKSKAADAAAWAGRLTPSTSVQGLTVVVDMDHIRNNQGDDQATLTLTYLWVDATKGWMLTEAAVDIDWGGTGGSTKFVITVGQAVQQLSNVVSALDDVLELVAAAFGIAAVYSGFAMALSVLSFGVAVLGGLVKYLINRADDGGQVNFLGCIFHAINRVSASINPDSTVAPVSTMNMAAIQSLTNPPQTYSFVPKFGNSSIENACFTTRCATETAFSYSGYTPYPLNPNLPFQIGIPELSWGPNGWETFVTAKCYTSQNDDAGDSSGYFLILMIVDCKAKMRACTFLVQGTDSQDGIFVPSPLFYQTADEASNGAWLAIGSSNFGPAVQQGVGSTIPQVIQSFANAMVAKDAEYTTLAQPAAIESIVWNGSTLNGGQSNVNPAIAINSSNQVVMLYSNGSELCYNLGTLNGNSYDWLATGVPYNGGNTPTVALTDDGWVVDVHEQYGNLYYSIGQISGASIVWKVVGKKYNAGYNPHITMNSDNYIVECHDSGCVNPGLFYDVGTLTIDGSSSSISFSTKGRQYDNGSNPCVAFTPDGWVMECHDNGNGADPGLFYDYGQVNFSDNSISWTKGGAYDSGAQPSFVVRPDNVIVETHASQDGSGGKVFVDYGILHSDHTVKWYSTSVSYGSGDGPTVALAPNLDIVEAHFSTGIVADVGIMTVPAGAEQVAMAMAG